MEGFSQKHVIGIPLPSFAYADEKTQGKPSCSSLVRNKEKKNSIVYRMSKLSQKTDTYMQGFKEHLALGSKISETVKGKLSLGVKVLQAGSMDKVFRQYFRVEKEEKLLKAFQCYLSTTAGPIAGMLFISTEKIAFHSDRPLDLKSPKGRITRVPYKVTKDNPPVNS
uniref:GRAM domain-containing protein n=1 Tax=Aegilops tauschii subsp. strangulata TaxID=200361 RepID=A0A452YHW8_AEGTS